MIVIAFYSSYTVIVTSFPVCTGSTSGEMESVHSLVQEREL